MHTIILAAALCFNQSPSTAETLLLVVYLGAMVQTNCQSDSLTLCASPVLGKDNWLPAVPHLLHQDVCIRREAV